MTKKSIKLKITLIVILVCLTTSFLLTIISIIQNKKQMFFSLQNKAENISNITVQNLIPALEFNDNTGIKEILNGLKNFQDFEYAVVLDNKNMILNYIGIEKGQIKELKKNIEMEETVTFYTEGFLNVSSPIFKKEERLGTLICGFTTSNVYRVIKGGIFSNIGFSLLITAIGVIFAFLLSSLIANPIKYFVKVVESVANGDLNRDVEVKTEDEIGILGNALNKMIVSLRKAKELESVKEETQKQKDESQKQRDTMAKLISESINKIGESLNDFKRNLDNVTQSIQYIIKGAQETTKSVGDSTMIVNNFVQAIDQIVKGTQEQLKSVENTANTMEDMSKNLDNIAKDAQGVSKEAEDTSSSVKVSSQSINKAILSTQEIKKTIFSVTQKINELSTSSKHIGDIIKVIDDIASQTNLLALNAAIEAARAGEQGRGFAVVAQEVRKLAERTTKATKEITTLIKNIQEKIETSVSIIENTKNEVEQASLLNVEAQGALEKILSSVVTVSSSIENISSRIIKINTSSDEVTNSVEKISAVVEENVAATEEMSASSTQIARSIEGVAAISEENSASADMVTKSVDEININIENIIASMNELRDISTKLGSMISV